MRCSMRGGERTNASVLPLPVAAMPIKSRPESTRQFQRRSGAGSEHAPRMTIGQHCAWMGDGCLNSLVESRAQRCVAGQA